MEEQDRHQLESVASLTPMPETQVLTTPIVLPPVTSAGDTTLSPHLGVLIDRAGQQTKMIFDRISDRRLC